MFSIFFLTCIFIGTFADDIDSSEAKYIDLLPEHEKKEFLDRIARRIFEEVQAKGGIDQASGEISDAKLDAHSAYVTKLLREEGKNLRKSGKNKEDKDSRSLDHSKEKKLDPNEEDIIDLTLREGKRNKRNKSRESSNEKEKVTKKAKNKSPENISVEISVKNKSKSKEVMSEIKTDSSEKIPVQVLYDDITKHEKTTKAGLRLRKNTSKENESSATEISEFSPEEIKSSDSVETKVESTTVRKEPSTEATTVQTITKGSEKSETNGMTERIYESMQDEDTSSDSDNKSQTDTNAKVSNESSSTEESKESSTPSETILTDTKNATEPLKDKTLNSTQVNKPQELTPVLRTNKEKESKVIDSKEDTSPTRKNYEVLTTTSKANIKEINNDLDENMKTKPDSTVLQKVKSTVTKGKPALRHGFFETSAETQIEDTKLFHELKSRYDNDKVKHYEVYEVNPDEVPFKNVQQQQKHEAPVEEIAQEEHPYYVPVYNYAPDNAYFNAHNRLGPNDDDDSEKTEESYEKRAIGREFYKHPRGKKKTKGAQRQRFLNKAKPAYDLLKYFKPVRVTPPSYINFHLQDYYDMDFYFGRQGDARKRRQNKKKKVTDESEETKKPILKFPDSDEPDHPMNKMHIKDHMSSIREILYVNKLFGHIPVRTTTKKPRKTTTYRNDTELNNLYNSTKLGDKHDENNAGSTMPEGLSFFDLLFLRSNMHSGKLREGHFTSGVKCPFNRPVSDYYYFGTDEATRAELAACRNEYENFDDDAKKTTEEKRYLLGSSNPADLLPTLEKLQSLKASRTHDDLESFLRVVKDMINDDNNALEQYDWLRTAVDIRSALKKLGDLSQQIKSSDRVHPADLELFKYILYLHKTTRKSFKAEDDNEDDFLIPAVIFNRGALPRKKNRGHKFIKDKGLMNRVWLRMVKGNVEFRREIRKFDEFLSSLDRGLYELHNAIKHIALITKYKNQNWYQNLKELYLSRATRADLLGLLLHFSASRLVTLLEDSSNKGLEVGISGYIEKHTDDVIKAKEELNFLLNILDELNA